jgi:hypothetical protein
MRTQDKDLGLSHENLALDFGDYKMIETMRRDLSTSCFPSLMRQMRHSLIILQKSIKWLEKDIERETWGINHA